MALHSLFDRSPVLPVDATISLARYLNTIRQTQRQAIATESSGDISRATLLHIRVLQLVCKTLPSHPDYTLPENAPVLQELRAVAHVGFRDVERLASQLMASTQKPRSVRRSRRKLCISSSLPLLFERISADRTLKGETFIGLLAIRPDLSATADHDDIVALIIPSQTHGTEWSCVCYERDVAHLLGIKELAIVGFISALPRARRVTLPLQAAKSLATVQSNFSNATIVVTSPQGRDSSSTNPSCFTLSEKSIVYVLSTDQTVLSETIPKDFDGEGEEVIIPARHVEWSDDGPPIFKLYDLRPLREDQPREGTEKRSSN